MNQEPEQESITSYIINNLSVSMLADIIRMYGFLVRKTNKRGDLAWASFKELLLKIDDKLTFTQWNLPCQSFYNTMKNDLQLFGDTIIDPETNTEKNDHEDKSLWEPHHFLLQHARIVHLSKPSLMRYLQICYNTGQLCAQMKTDQSHYTQKQKEYINQPYKNNDSHFYNVQAYISESDINDLNIKLKDEEIKKVMIDIIEIGMKLGCESRQILDEV